MRFEADLLEKFWKEEETNNHLVQMDIWTFIQDKLNETNDVILMIVLDSSGSSPGRQGFKMAVSADHAIKGSIGGGIMEHKLVEKCKKLLSVGNSKIEYIEQYHNKDHDKNQSGMICSGSQTIAFIPLMNKELKLIDNIISANNNDEEGYLLVEEKGMSFVQDNKLDQPSRFQFNKDYPWQYKEIMNKPFVIHIIGGGHVGLALSEVMRFLGFYIKVYDDRKELNTMDGNQFAHEKIYMDYSDVNAYLNSNEEDYLVIMSFGYRNDKEIYTQVFDRKFAYIGMMGSVEKVNNIMEEFKSEGISPDRLERLHAPIGINISSKTPQEIAISIAAEIVREKNKNFPSSRKYNLK